MVRLSILLIVLVVVVVLVLGLQENPGAVTARWGDYEVQTTALFAALALVFLIAILMPVMRLLTAIIEVPGRFGRFSERQRRRKGQEALALGLIAAEAGEFDEAQRYADKGRDLIDEPRLVKLLEARAAEVAGDVPAAERAYSGMLSHEDTELLGRKGLLQAALKRGDRASAMTHAEASIKLSRTAEWPVTTLFELQVQAGEWQAALETLEVAERRRMLDGDVVKRRRAVLLTAAAARFERELRAERADDLLEKALRLAPGFAPAAALSSRLLVADGKTWKAASVLEEAWEVAPHPALAHAYRDLKSDEPRAERAKRMAGLVELKPEHRESKIIQAELAMEQGDFQGAWGHLEHAYRELPSSRICGLFAAICRARGDEQAAKQWMGQAAIAPREPDWSDLDPEGPAFLYQDSDWARLVYVFGDAGQLIHPRYERGERDVGGGSVLALPPAAKPALDADPAAASAAAAPK